MKKGIFFLLITSFLASACLSVVATQDAEILANFKLLSRQDLCEWNQDILVVRLGDYEDKKYMVVFRREASETKGDALSRGSICLYILIHLNQDQSSDPSETILPLTLKLSSQIRECSYNHPFAKRCYANSEDFLTKLYAYMKLHSNPEDFVKDCSYYIESFYKNLLTIGTVSFIKTPPEEVVRIAESIPGFGEIVDENLAELGFSKILEPTSIGFISADGQIMNFITNNGSILTHELSSHE